ncbi:MAG: glycosyltransferase, partial [Mycobacterium sp.]
MRDEHDLLVDIGHEPEQLIVDNPAGSFRSAGRFALSAWNPLAARLVTQRVRSSRPDVAHVHNTWYSLTPSVVAALAREGIPVVATMHNFRLACVNGLLFREGRVCEDCVGRLPWPGVVHRCYRGSGVQSGMVAASLVLHRGLHTWQRDVDRFVV